MSAEQMKPPAYRIATLSADGVVLSSQTVNAQTDEDALAAVRSMLDGHDVELWDGLRFIEYFKSSERE